jgi:predicted esterase
MEADWTEATSFVHHFDPGRVGKGPVLLLLHGTGGDENDLVPIGQVLRPGAPLISPRGQVLENGMPRFFRRIAEGVFDLDDLERRTRDLAEWIAAARERYAFGARPLVAVGFSNGANIAASLLFSSPETLEGAVLFRAMTPFEPATLPDLGRAGVFIGAGENDPLIEHENVERLAALLRRAGARVDLEWDRGGHALTPSAIAAARRWLEREFPAG